MTTSKQALERKIDSVLAVLKQELLYFHDKDPVYAEQMVKWFQEVGVKNKHIHASKSSKRDKEMGRRRRGNVFYIDFGVNVGSEFNFPHFGVVIAEFRYHALVVPISSVKKEDENGWKKEEQNLYVEIGKIKGFPETDEEQTHSYAVVSKIREVSKQRLSDYRVPGTRDYIKLFLTDDQMDLIDEAMRTLCTKKEKE